MEEEHVKSHLVSDLVRLKFLHCNKFAKTKTGGSRDIGVSWVSHMQSPGLAPGTVTPQKML